MAKKQAVESSQHGPLVRRSQDDIRKYIKSGKFKADSARLKEHLRKNGGEPSAEDLKEIPLFGGVDPALFRPVKKRITVRLDADVVAWLKSEGPRYQSRLNAVLRKAMTADKN